LIRVGLQAIIPIALSYSGGDWANDELIGFWLKWTSGDNKDTTRVIIDNTVSLIKFSPKLSNIVSQYDSFAIWDTSVGFNTPEDSVVIFADTIGEGGSALTSHFFDGMYFRRTYDGYLAADSISLSPMVSQSLSTGRRRPLLIKLGGVQ